VPAFPLDLCLAGGDVTDVRVRPGGMWISGVHTEVRDAKKISRLRMWHVTDSSVVDLVTDPEPAPGRGLSGGVHNWSHDGSRVCVVLRSGALAIVDVAHMTTPTTSHATAPRQIADDGAWTTPTFSLDDQSVWAVRDWHDVVRLSPSPDPSATWHQTQHFHEGDFAWDVDEWNGAPIFHAWNRPHMPWTESQIVPVSSEVAVGVQQPRVSRNGKSLGFLSDQNGVLNLTIIRNDATTVIEDEFEHGGPTWGSGNRSWCFNSDGTMVAYTRNEDGFGSLWIRSVGASGAPLMVGKAVHGCVSWEGNTLAAIRSGARTPPEVVAYNMTSLLLPQAVAPSKKVVFFAGDVRWNAKDIRDELVEPIVVKVPPEEITDPEITVRLYRPHSANGALLAWAHGGPTDQWQVAFMPRHAYWISRGYTIAVIDYRGSTGYGRQFQQSLEGEWGRGDGKDVVRATRCIQQQYGFNPDNTILFGGSAGGLAALSAVVHAAPGIRVAAAAVLSYPVVDLLALASSGDPFEAHYVPTLVGAGSDKDQVWGQRSPHLHPRSFLETSLLIFHGDADTVVPLAQSEILRDAVTSVGGDATLHVLAGEGHGFREPQNLEFEYRTTEDFLTRFVP